MRAPGGGRTPQAGGTCLIMILDKGPLEWGLLVPVLLGSFVMVFWATVLNNANPRYHYPRYWLWRCPPPRAAGGPNVVQN